MIFFKKKGAKAWTIVTAIALVLFLAVNIVATQVFAGLFDTLLGGDRAIKKGTTGSNEYYTASKGIVDKKTSLSAGNALTEKICEEGFTLLKNDGALPIKTSAQNKVTLSVFGKNSVNIAYGSSGSVGASGDGATTLKEALEQAGYAVNEMLWGFYSNDSLSGGGRGDNSSMSSNNVDWGVPTGETPVSAYPQSVKDSFAQSNAALVVVTRTSGENHDLPTTMKDKKGNPVKGAASASDHYLELDQNEQDMLQLACENFDKVILIINSSTTLELGFLDSRADGDVTVNDYDYASKVNAALWIGMPGAKGIKALGKILSGEVNPSGRTIDTYARDFMKIPAVANFSNDGKANTGVYSNLSNAYYIDYEEGIYIGYRYYETRCLTDGEKWYADNVVYPFGYGLSYSEFSWEIVDKSKVNGAALKQDSSFTIEVDVTNNSAEYAGKDVVELYATPPYTEGKTEKSAKVLLAFAKTPLIEKGKTERMTLTFDAYDMASWNSQKGGYELGKGEYVITLGKNAHDAVDTFTLKADKDIEYSKDPGTEYPLKNRFDDADDQLDAVLSRANWQSLKNRTDSEKVASADFSAKLSSRETSNPLTETSREIIENQKNRPAPTSKSQNGIQLYELRGLSVGDERWDEIVGRVTVKDMWSLISMGAFNTKEITYVGKPKTMDTDGPAGFVNFMSGTGEIYDTTFYCSECVVGATWNVDLAYEMGVAIGDEGLMGDRRDSDSAKWRTYSGLYAPGVNLHRTPFGGRNPEYYSEDPVLSGELAAKVIEGAQSKGVYMFMKHFAVNEQETHRGGVCTWVSEQALRELYLKPFEIAIKKGKATAVMSSFTRLGAVWTGGSYELLTEVLRNEWGFKGMVITDFASGQSHMNIRQMLYAGGDLWLDTINPGDSYRANNPVDVYCIQEATKHILYTVANSNAMNGIGEGVIYEMQMSYWRMGLIALDIVVGLALVAWLVVLLLNKQKQELSQ